VGHGFALDYGDKPKSFPAKLKLLARLLPQAVLYQPSIARSAGFEYFNDRVSGVPLRSTPGFMLTPASRVRHSFHPVRAFWFRFFLSACIRI